MTNQPLVVVPPNGRNGLQLLRVTAILSLVAYHAALIAPQPAGDLAERIVQRAAGTGWIGTDMFLALGGFLAFCSRDRATSHFHWLARRAARVLPSYWAFLLLYLHIIPWALVKLGCNIQALSNYGALDRARAHQGYLFTLSTNLLFAKGTWIGAALEPMLTIAIGVQLVVLTSLIMPLRRGYGFLIAVFALECLGIGLRFIWRNETGWRCYSFPLTRCDAFLFGLIAAWAMHREELRARLVRATPVLWKIGLAVGAVALLGTRGLLVNAKATIQLGYPIIGFCCAIVVLALSQLGGVVPDTESQPPLALRILEPSRLFDMLSRMGVVTYGAYLVKLPLMDLVKDLVSRCGFQPRVLTLAALGVLAALLGGWFWFAWIERPLSRALSSGLAQRK